jgi:Flp pilus assembly pilin Flp
MNTFNPRDPSAAYFRAFLGIHIDKLRQARRDGERGASAIELAIITGVLVGLAIIVLLVIKTEVDNGKRGISKTIPNP